MGADDDGYRVDATRYRLRQRELPLPRETALAGRKQRTHADEIAGRHDLPHERRRLRGPSATLGRRLSRRIPACRCHSMGQATSLGGGEANGPASRSRLRDAPADPERPYHSVVPAPETPVPVASVGVCG